MTTKRWHLKGEYFDNCNCEVLCPCLVQGRDARPTYGHCEMAEVFHIDEGEFNGIPLGGLNFVMAMYTPGVMTDGNWTSGLYIDERATAEQREAISQIMSGKMGGPAERWMSLTTNFMGIKYVPIEFKAEGGVRSVTIPDIMDFNIEPINARNQTEAMLLTNTANGVNRDLYLAKGTRSTYADHGMRWDNTGKSGYYASFDWRWP